MVEPVIFPRLVTRVYSAMALIVLMLVVVGALGAQTRFQWPAANVDLSHYTTVEECLAATERVSDSVWRRRAIWRDTVPFQTSEVHERQAPAIVATAQQCSKQFPPEQVPLRDWSSFALLYLFAERDDDINTLMQRQFAALPGTVQARDSLRGRDLKVLLDLYLGRGGINRTIRYSAAQTVFDQLLALPHFDAESRITFLKSIMSFAQQFDDRERARWAAEQIVTLAGGMAQEQGQPRPAWHVQRTHNEALDYLSRDAQLDSLRKGTAGYVALRRANWVKATGNASGSMSSRIGERAPTLAGDFWFPKGTTPDTAGSFNRPSAGHVNLIVFLTYECRGGHLPLHHQDLSAGHQGCWDTYAVLRRLATQYPELDITIVTRTAGFFWPRAPLQPSEEAAMYRDMWMGFHRLPVTLSVSTTTFWRIEDPDQRRMNDETVNITNYGIGQQTDNKFAVLVDRDGIILEAMEVGRQTEPQLTQLLKALWAK